MPEMIPVTGILILNSEKTTSSARKELQFLGISFSAAKFSRTLICHIFKHFSGLDMTCCDENSGNVSKNVTARHHEFKSLFCNNLSPNK